MVGTMELRKFGPDDEVAVRQYVDIVNAVSDSDSPWDHELTYAGGQGRLRYGWDGDIPESFLIESDGEPVGYANYFVPTWDNQHLAWVNVQVHPEHRRRGHGSAVIEAFVDRARAEGKRTIGSDGWDSPRTLAFAERHGFTLAGIGVCRRQMLADVDWAVVEALHNEAAGHAAAYDLERTLGPSRPEALPELAEITAAINDAPTDDLDFEDEVFTVERVARYENAQASRGHLLHRLVARQRETGRPAGQSIVTVDLERPTLGEQHDTSVMREHRGHRLGLYLKTAMLLWLREDQPQLVYIDTGNAESNAHMIAINEQLGYRIMDRELELQRSL
jgi:GNAT superfamily N-acetyltransferase